MRRLWKDFNNSAIEGGVDVAHYFISINSYVIPQG